MADIHVSVTGNDGAMGHENAPLKTINAALGKAAAGDTITVHDGTYKETVNLSKPGVTLRAANSRKAVIDGGYGPGKFKADNTLPPVDSAKQYSPLVKISGAGSVVAGFVIRNSPGRGAQLVADGAQLIDCHVDFCYSHTVWVGDCAGAIVDGCIVTRGSLRAFDPTRSMGTPMGVDTCLALVRAVNPSVFDTVVAFNYGEGLGLTKNTAGATIAGVTAFSNLHDNIYVSGGGTGATLVGCVAFQPADTEAMMKLCGLNQYGNVTLGDEEQDQQSGPGLVIRNCLFLPSVNGRPFTIDGWNGAGNFPRPFVLDGAHIANCTIVAGPKNATLALFGSSTHRAHKNSLIENLVLLAAPGVGGIAAPSYGAGHGDVVYRNNLSNRPFPAAIAGKDSATTAAPILVNPFVVIETVAPFDVRSPELPDVRTTFDLANYAPVKGSPALGLASDGSPVNGITPTQPAPDYVGAVDVIYEPEPEPEPEPPAWGQALVNLSAALQAAYEAHEAAQAAIDAADDKLALAGECFVELVNRLNEGAA
jgi:hypothetical protein